MNEQTPQVPGHGLSHDDLAATLGYITTLSEHHMNIEQAMSQPQQGQQPQEQQPSEVNSSGTQAQTKDESQDKEITDIRAELEKLQQEISTNGQSTDTATNTGTPQ